MHSIAWWPTMAPTLIVLAVATYTDLRWRRIPNWLVLPFLLAGIVAAEMGVGLRITSGPAAWHVVESIPARLLAIAFATAVRSATTAQTRNTLVCEPLSILISGFTS